MGLKELKEQAMQTWRRLESVVRKKQNSNEEWWLPADGFIKKLENADESGVLEIIRKLEREIARLDH